MKRRYILLSFFLLAGLLLLFFLDQPIRDVITLIRSDQFLQVMAITSDIGSWPFLALIATILLILGFLRRDKRSETAGRYGLFSVLCSQFIVEILKHLFGRPRPDLFGSDGFRIGPTFARGYDSFPSGHAGSSFAFAYMLSRFYPEKRYFFYAGAVIISLSRVCLDFHFASDIYAGGIVGFISGMALYNYLKTKRVQ